MIVLSTKLKNQFSPSYNITLKNISVNGDKRGCSGFVSLGDSIVYVSTERCGKLGMMYRTAKHLKDYTGGVNHWAADMDSLVVGIKTILRKSF